MSFAYAQGMIEVLKNSAIKASIKWSGYRAERRPAAFRYILAPENGSAGTVNVGDWEQIWQYGSNLGQTDPDPMWQQDGVAPQAAVGGLAVPITNGGRAYIPKNQNIPKGFVESHSIGNYGWIFEQQEKDPGHVKSR